MCACVCACTCVQACSLTSPASKAHALYYIVICGLSGATIFFDIINGMIFGKKLWKKNVCFDFLYKFYLKYFSF
jgi:hypothetical protein